MSNQLIYLSILVASLGTYFCRAFGVLSARNISPNSPVFNWIKCVSIGVISAVIARIILFPAGILGESTSFSRIVCTLIALGVYFYFKKNVLLAVLSSAICFGILNHFL
ncbi:MAG: AzlD domain-containing protein [Pelagibacteraceae bacterium]